MLLEGLLACGCWVGETDPELLFLFGPALRGFGVRALIGEGMDDCSDGGMIGMLFEGSGMMFLLGRVYAVMPD